MNKWRELLLVFVIGGLLLCVGDYFHLQKGIASYQKFHSFTLMTIPFWVPIQFGLACSIGMLLISQEGRLPFPLQKPKAVGPWAYGLSAIFVMITYLMSSFYTSDPIIKTILIMILGMIPWLLFDGTVPGLGGILGAVVGGIFYESMLGQLGIFVYTPSLELIPILNVPFWLVGIYASAATAIRTLSYSVFDL